MQVSVLLPYRDAAATVGEAIESVLTQDGVRFELLAIDDRSRDSGPEIVARIAARDRRVVALRSPGRGISAALNRGLQAARAPLCARMDADDLCLPGRLAAQCARMQGDPDLAALGCRVEAFPDAALAPGMRRYLAWQNSLLAAKDHAHQLFVESPLCHPSVMLRRREVLSVGGYRSGAFPEDYDLWLRLHERGWSLAKLPEVLLRWRRGPGQATFDDPRYARARFLELKAPHLARHLRGRLSPGGRELTFWGAGKTGKQLARALEPHGIATRRFVDIDPKKIGRSARGAPVVAPDSLGAPQRQLIVVAVGAAGARDQVRAYLNRRGFAEGRDYLCAS